MEQREHQLIMTLRKQLSDPGMPLVNTMGLFRSEKAREYNSLAYEYLLGHMGIDNEEFLRRVPLIYAWRDITGKLKTVEKGRRWHERMRISSQRWAPSGHGSFLYENLYSPSSMKELLKGVPDDFFPPLILHLLKLELRFAVARGLHEDWFVPMQELLNAIDPHGNKPLPKFPEFENAERAYSNGFVGICLSGYRATLQFVAKDIDVHNDETRRHLGAKMPGYYFLSFLRQYLRRVTSFIRWEDVLRCLERSFRSYAELGYTDPTYLMESFEGEGVNP